MCRRNCRNMRVSTRLGSSSRRREIYMKPDQICMKYRKRADVMHISALTTRQCMLTSLQRTIENVAAAARSRCRLWRPPADWARARVALALVMYQWVLHSLYVNSINCRVGYSLHFKLFVRCLLVLVTDLVTQRRFSEAKLSLPTHTYSYFSNCKSIFRGPSFRSRTTYLVEERQLCDDCRSSSLQPRHACAAGIRPAGARLAAPLRLAATEIFTSRILSPTQTREMVIFSLALTCSKSKTQHLSFVAPTTSAKIKYSLNRTRTCQIACYRFNFACYVGNWI